MRSTPAWGLHSVGTLLEDSLPLPHHLPLPPAMPSQSLLLFLSPVRCLIRSLTPTPALPFPAPPLLTPLCPTGIPDFLPASGKHSWCHGERRLLRPQAALDDAQISSTPSSRSSRSSCAAPNLKPPPFLQTSQRPAPAGCTAPQHPPPEPNTESFRHTAEAGDNLVYPLPVASVIRHHKAGG